MSRQTSERLEKISSAIFVPLTTTVALSISKRTICPSRRSVGCWWGAELALGPDLRAALFSRIGPDLPKRKLSANPEQKTMRKKTFNQEGHEGTRRTFVDEFPS